MRSSKIVLLKPLVQGLLLTHVGKGAEPQGDGSLAKAVGKGFRPSQLLPPVSDGDPRALVSSGVWRGLEGVGSVRGRGRATLVHPWGRASCAFREVMSSWWVGGTPPC